MTKSCQHECLFSSGVRTKIELLRDRVRQHVCRQLNLFSVLYISWLASFTLFFFWFIFPEIVQKWSTVNDSNLWLPNHPLVLIADSVWQLQLCKWPCEQSWRRSDGGCWNNIPSVSPSTMRTTAAHLRQFPQACISSQKSCTSLMIWVLERAKPIWLLLGCWTMLWESCGSDPRKTSKPYWLIWHTSMGEELSQGLIQSSYICFVWIVLMHGMLLYLIQCWALNEGRHKLKAEGMIYHQASNSLI